MMKPLFLTFLCLISCNYLNAQSIKGKLIDQKTTKGIAMANLVLRNKSQVDVLKYTSSDSTGLFEFNKIPIGNYTLSVSLLGYQKVQQNINIETESSKVDLGNISMFEDPAMLKEITISGEAPNFVTQNGNLKLNITNNAFFKSAANMLDVFRKLPGLQVNGDGTMQMASRATPTLFVDGKPANMNAEEIQAYLSSLSPDMVETIEMINQPSSKYDAEYQGIIDVRLKRTQSLGLKGIYNTRFQRNNYSLLDNSLSLVYKAPKFVYDLKLGYTNGSTVYKYHALQYLANTNAMITDTRTVTSNNNFNVQAKVAYEPKKGHAIEAFLRNFEIDRNAISDNYLTTQNNSLTQTLGQIKSDNNANPKQHNYAGGINYDAQFKNSELHIITAIAQIDNRQGEDIQNRNLTNNILQNYWKTNSKNNILIRSLQADYSEKIKNYRIEFGGKYAYTSTNNNLRYDTLANNIFSLDPKRSNQFRYQEYISAGYLSFYGSRQKINYNIGLRAEYTQSMANSLTTGLITERRYLKWLPSLSITYSINKNEQLNVSYSRRLTRPTFAALNPFRFYYSPRQYWIGNPYLQPSTTNLFALSYSLKMFNVTLNAGRETDVISRYPEYNAEKNELIFLGRNQPYRNFVNLQLNSPINFTKWWKMNNNIALYYNKELTPYFGATYKIPIYNYTINGSQVFSFRDWLLDMGYTYQSKSGNGLYIFKPNYGMDFGLQKTWFNKNLNTKLTFYDAFDTMRRRLVFREKQIINNQMYDYFANHRLVFSLTYNFGSSNYKAKESKRSEEENRAN